MTSLIATVGHTESEKPLFPVKGTPVAKALQKGCWTGGHGGPLEPCKSMKNGNDSKLPWMKEEPPAP
jgi:hypothetical protein